MRRRGFFAAPLAAFAQQQSSALVIGYGDGIPHTPAEHAQLLTKLASGIELDDYSRGGVVEKLEAEIARTLGKETAVWLPTGTLANHLALRVLCGPRRRALV